MKSLERWEYAHPPSLWFSVLSIYFCITTWFNHLSHPISSPNNYCQSLTVIEQVRCGASDKPLNFMQKLRLKFNRNSVRNNCLCPSPLTEISRPEIFDNSERTKLGFPNGSSNGNGIDNGNFDEAIGTKAWEKWVCPNPNEVISRLDFWSDVVGDQDKETWLDNLENMDMDSDDEEMEEAFPRRRLLISPTPTGKLDQQNLIAFDLTNKKLKPMYFPSREGIQLNMNHRSLRKAVYSHSTELDLSDLDSRVPCPVQVDSSKYQRTDC